MRTIASRVTVSLSIAIITIILLPVIVSAETQTVMNETVIFNPSENNNDELVNVANESVAAWNIDTWPSRPAGIFVGGTYKESLLQINEIGIDTENQLMVGTVMQFQSSYISTGASEFVVRLPLYIESNASSYPLEVNLWVYQVTDQDFSFWSSAGGSMGVIKSGTTRAFVNDVANFWKNNADPATYPIYTDVSHNSWLTENRLYARVVAPLMADEVYLFVVQAKLRIATPMKVYFHPSDLCSDNITNSRIGYAWNTDPDTLLFRDYPVTADAGWSFVFQVGLGASSRDWNYYYDAYSILHFWKWVEVTRLNASGYAYGAFTFVLEFRTNTTADLTFNLTVIAEEPGGGSVYLLNRAYWNLKKANDVIIAGNPVNHTIVPYYVNGKYWVLLEVFLELVTAGRIQIMMEYDHESPTNTNANYFEILRPYGAPSGWWEGWLEREVWFAPWCTGSFANSTWNRTDEITPHNHKGFWSGVGSWWDKHWVDVLGVVMIIGGALLIVTGVGAGFGVGLIAGGIGLLLYNNIDFIHSAVDKFISTIVDALKGLGNWLYKLGEWLWKALTWVIDQIVYYGSIILGLLMVGGAMALLVFPLTWEIKILGAFEALARGDTERAQRALGEATTSMRRVGGVVTGGRV